MEASDKIAITEFARSLPEEDLLFLRTDITDPATIEEWIRNLENDTTITFWRSSTVRCQPTRAFI
jgi:hypothetical protein